jgi:hypothetical protein
LEDIMKECPVCKESFGDDFSFCDLDGSPLGHGPGTVATASATSGKVWSVFGVVLLLGAIVISVAVVVFFPRRPATGLGATVPSADVTSSSARSNPPQVPQVVVVEQGASDSKDSVQKSENAEVRAGDPDAAPIKKAPAPKAQDSGSAPLDPKAAAKAADEGERPLRKNVEPESVAAEKKRVVPPPDTPAVKPTVEPPSEEAAAKPATNPPQPKKDAKGKVSKSDTAASAEKTDKKDEKKKGGFFKVFKKIFGKS